MMDNTNSKLNKMKIGDNILITESAYGSELLTVGKEYEVLDFDFDGEPVVTLDDGQKIGLCLNQIEYKLKLTETKPKQYQIGIDTFQRAEANMTKDEILACVRFNIDKYNWRKKGQDKEDFEKIIKYAEWALKQMK
jgi:hypothetical protein